MGLRVGAGPPHLRVRVNQGAGDVGMDKGKEGLKYNIGRARP